MEIFNDLLNLDGWLIFKAFFLILVGGYCLFALIVVRQVQLMTSVLKTSLSPWLKFLAIGHLIFAGGVFLWVLFLL